MVPKFTPETLILNFGPRSHVRWSSREFLLWPTWAYRVVAPRIRERKLNVLQRAVMGLCRAGIYRAETIADHLSVHADLAAFIFTELSEAGYLDRRGLPTQNGLLLLEEEALVTQEMAAGFVFQDPWTGDLWPRFAETLDYCEREFKENGYPNLLLGTKGKPRYESPFTVLPRTEVGPATPTASAVMQAVSRHRKGLRFLDEDDIDEDSLGSFVASGVQLNRVSFVEEEPHPYFLMTYLYVPESDTGALDWFACDPFGIRQSVRLRRQVETVMKDDNNLLGVVNRLFGKSLDSSYEDQQRWLDKILIKAERDVYARLGINFRNHSAFDQVLEMESTRGEMRGYGSECPSYKIKDVLRAGLKVLEALFASLADTHPLGDIWKRVYVQKLNDRTGAQYLAQQQDQSILRASYEGAFQSLGFAEPFPAPFLGVKPGQIRAVAEYHDTWRLRPLVTATALLAQRDSTHPFALAARAVPELLVTIDEIASAGGAAGHASRVPVSPDHAEQHVDKVYKIISALLGLTDSEPNPSNERNGGLHGQEEE
ncbi:MAG: hypothetical protein ABIL62_06370 [Planctomycetota bacterium]